LCCQPGKFLTTKCPLRKSTKCDPKDLGEFMMMELNRLDAEFSARSNSYYINIVHWVTKMNSDALIDMKLPGKNDMHSSTEFLKVRANLIITGLDMATEIKRNLKTLILMY